MSHDTWIHRCARVLVRPLAESPVTPNQITTLRLVTGLGAAAALAHGDPPWQAWGAGIFLLSMVLDRADGELARLSGKSSPWGHAYDLVSDTLCNVAAFVGLGFGLRGELGTAGALMGLLAGLAIAAVLWLVLRVEARHGRRAAELGPAAGFDPDDALLLLPLAIWLGLAEWLLIASAVGAPAFALFMLVRFRRRLGPAG